MIRVIIAFTIFLVFSFFSVLTAQTVRPKPIQIYQKDGISVKAYDFKAFEPLLKIENDTTYVINFWATWCQPCVAELPNFEKVNAAFNNRKLKVILVSLDMKKQVETALLPFIKRKKLQSEVIFMNDPDANSWISKVDENWSGAIPATVIYNSKKRQFYEKSFTFDELNNEIKQFIN